MLARVRDTTADALSYQDLPFEKLVEELAPDRSLAHSPLFQVQFAYQSLTPPALALDGVTASAGVVFTETAKLDLTMYADVSERESAALVLEYSTDLFGPAWADRFLHCVAHLLEAPPQAPQTPVADLPMLSAAEQDALPPGATRRRSRPMRMTTDDVRRLLLQSTSRVIDPRRHGHAGCLRPAPPGSPGRCRPRGRPETPVGLCLGRTPACWPRCSAC